jgi:serine/threonine-protein kinase
MEDSFSRKYRLGERIGSGGMAEIFRAHIVGAAGFEREVAVKRIRPELASDPAFIEMFIREAALAARLVHPNIVQVFDFDSSAGSYFIAMELVRGWDLKAIEMKTKRQSRRIPLEVAVGIVIDVLDGLAHAHALLDDDGAPLGIIHRDLSPHNVMVSALGQVKLTDFGIARAAFSSMVTNSGGSQKGKLVYMSPEQVQSRSIDHRSDLFSAGVMLFELLAGYRPFDADSDYAVMSRIVRGDMAELPADIAGPLAAIVRKALAREPEQRYQSAPQLRDALRTFAEHHALDPGKVARRDYLAKLFGAQADSMLRAPSSRPSLVAPGQRERRDGRELHTGSCRPGLPLDRVAYGGLARDELGLAPEQPLSEERHPGGEPSLTGVRQVAIGPGAGGGGGPPRRAGNGEQTVPGRLSGSHGSLQGSFTGHPPAGRGSPPAAELDGVQPIASELEPLAPSEASASGELDRARGARPPRALVSHRWWWIAAALGTIVGLGVATIALLHVGSSAEVRVRTVVRLRDDHLRWFEREVTEPFAAKEGLAVDISTYSEIGALLQQLTRDRLAGTTADLVAVPFIGARAVAEAGLMTPLDEIATRSGVPPEQLGRWRNAFEPDAVAACEYTTVTGRATYYMPRQLETRLLVYRTSKVREAAELWPQYRAGFEQELERLGLPGLPEGYQLEPNPWRWDLFDMLAVGYVWARSAANAPDGAASASMGNRRGAPGRMAGRIGRRSLRVKYFGLVAELLDLAAALGASPTELKAPSEALVDAIEWETARWALGVYHSSVLDSERGASSTTLIESMRRGEIYAAMLEQQDALLVRGSLDSRESPTGGRGPFRDAAGGLGASSELSEDLDVAPAPEGVSIRLGDDRLPLRRGGRRALVEGWLWGIPKGAPHPLEAWKLLRHLTSPEVQERESLRFLTISGRRDYMSPSSHFGRRAFEASRLQLAASTLLLPPRYADYGEFERYRESMLSAWSWLVVKQRSRGPTGAGPLDRELIRKALVRLL